MAKVALMSSWNACCGVSIHAELIGRALLRLGHKLTVFAPRQYEDDVTYLTFALDEEFVTRNYSFLRYGDRCTDESLLNSLYFDYGPMLDSDFDLIIVEKPTSTPLGRLRKLLPEIKKRARTMAILHEGATPTNPFFRSMSWDAVAIFDERYKALFSQVFPEEKTHIVPFPCHPLNLRSKAEARGKVGLPMEAKVVFSFGRFHESEFVLKTLGVLRGEYPELVYLCLAGDTNTYRSLQALKRKYGFLEVRFGRPKTLALYDYIGAADALVFHKGFPPHIAVSSSVHLCLGALIPILCSDVAYFYTFTDEVLKYLDAAQFENRLRVVFEGGTQEVLAKARRFVEEHRADAIAEQLLEIGLGLGP